MDLFYYIKLPFAYLLEWLTTFTGNFGLALLVFAVIVKLVLFPVSAKGKKGMMKMTRLTPRVKALELEYADDKTKYQQEVQKLYKQEGVSTCGGCIWSLIPLILLIPLYEVIREPIHWLMHLDADGVEAVRKVFEQVGLYTAGTNQTYWQMLLIGKIPLFAEQIKAAVPAIADSGILNASFSFLGIDLGVIPKVMFWAEGLDWNHIGQFLIPIFSGASNFLSMLFSQKLNNTVVTNEKGERDETAAKANQTGKAMTYMMPVMSVVFGFIMPAGLSIYWIAQAFLGIIQEYVLTNHYRKVYDAEDALKQQRAAEEAALEAERERVRQERREKNPEGIVDNTSKKKLQQKKEAERAAAEAAYLEKMTAQVESDGKHQPTDETRRYSRGRAYRPDRYGEAENNDSDKE